MDATLLPSLTQASALERKHTTMILNHKGDPAQPGDLIVLGPNDEATKAALLLKIHKDDTSRIWAIYHSNKCTGALDIACKGNGDKLGNINKLGLSTTKDRAAVKLEELSLTTPVYLFAGCRVTDVLSAVQVQQASQLAVEQTLLWSWLHQGRVTSRNAAKALVLWRHVYSPALIKLGVGETLSKLGLGDSFSIQGTNASAPMV